MNAARLGKVVSIIVLAGGLSAYAQRGEPPMERRETEAPRPEPREMPFDRPRPMLSPIERAKLAGATETQIQELSAALYDLQLKRIDMQAAAEKAELTLDHLMRTPKADEKAILQAADALNQTRGELFKLEISTQLKIRQILGEETARKMEPPRGDRERPVPPGAEQGAGTEIPFTPARTGRSPEPGSRPRRPAR